MAYNFIECNREQEYLLPVSLKEWLSEGDLGWFIIDAVEQMDLIGIYNKYRLDGKGQAAYEPSMMVSLLIYAYCMGERSSRKIERLCERDIMFKIIAANKVPDHSSINRFRQENGERLGGLFNDVLKLCAEAGLVRVGIVALDGVKIKAEAALESNRSYGHIEKEVAKMLLEAEAVDVKEDELYGRDKRGDEIPEGLRDRSSRLKRLKECKERLEREAKEVGAKQKEKMKAREAVEAETGKKKRGRKPKEAVFEPQAEEKANITDPESRIMKTRSGYIQGYNGQAVVTEGQMIIAAELTNKENDVNELHPMVEKAKENIEAIKEGIGEIGEKIGDMAVVLSDAGYCSENNLKEMEGKEIEHIMAAKKDWKERKAMRESPSPRGRRPNGLSLKERMERKLLTKRGKGLYKKRGQIVEAVFGQIKGCRGIVKFMRRGLIACREEWKMICATHNLLKLWRSTTVLAAQTAI